jgi:RNA polymerase sigma-70 factor (ECF subfamily)
MISNTDTHCRCEAATDTKRVADGALCPDCQREAAFIKRIQGRDHQAIGDLFDSFYELVFSIGFRVLRDSGEAEDLVQEVFLYLYRNANAYDPLKGTIRAWVVRVAWHRSINRKQYLMSRFFYRHDPVDERGNFASVDPRDLDHLHHHQQLLEVALSSLTERQRRAIHMYCYEGREMHEIATAMNDSVVNVRAHYYRGLAKLRTVLGKEYAVAGNA